jgi:hypothetical protein
MTRPNPQFLEMAKQYADENDTATSLSFIAQYVGYEEASRAFLLIRQLHLIDGELHEDLRLLRDRWRAELRTYTLTHFGNSASILHLI